MRQLKAPLMNYVQEELLIKQQEEMTELKFNLNYTKDNAGTYVKVPFDMPEGTERIEVDYDYHRFNEETHEKGSCRREVNIIDLGIYDEKENLFGWSGSNQKSIFISSISASPGYHHGILNNGKWFIALGLYKIESTIDVMINIRLFQREKKLYRGDLHIHTVNSDGSYTTNFVITSSQAAGLDFIALTDHNNTKQNSEIGNPDKISVIPGVEFTNYKGHANFYFPDRNIKFEGDFLSNNFEEVCCLFKHAKESGAIISINHPVSDYPWDFGFKGLPFDLIEVWNGPMREHNMQSIALWHEMLKDGRKISAVGGSDLHRNSASGTFANPCTMIYSDSPNPQALLSGLLAGRACVSYEPGGPYFEFDIDGSGMGDTVLYKDGLHGKVIINSIKKGDVVKIINCEGVSDTFTASFNGQYIHTFKIEDCTFYRIELYRKLLDEPVLCALSNPVYITA